MGRRLTDEQHQAQRTEAMDRLQAHAEELLTSDGRRGFRRDSARQGWPPEVS